MPPSLQLTALETIQPAAKSKSFTVLRAISPWPGDNSNPNCLNRALFLCLEAGYNLLSRADYGIPVPSQIASNSWTDQVFKAMAELRAQSSHADNQLDVGQRDDLDRLVSASASLEALLSDTNPETDTLQHDIRNVLGAMRGYAELLLEDVDNLFPQLQASLQRVIKAVASASDDSVRSVDGGDDALNAGITGTILAVDDSADNRELLSRYLSKAGHEVLTASSGEEALGLLENSTVDLVLLDLIMPGMDGGEVLRRIKENPAWRALSVIVISGRQDMEGIIECIEAGADDYLFKPFNRVLLHARIKAGLERKRWHDLEGAVSAPL